MFGPQFASCLIIDTKWYTKDDLLSLQLPGCGSEGKVYKAGQKLYIAGKYRWVDFKTLLHDIFSAILRDRTASRFSIVFLSIS